MHSAIVKFSKEYIVWITVNCRNMNINRKTGALAFLIRCIIYGQRNKNASTPVFLFQYMKYLFSKCNSINFSKFFFGKVSIFQCLNILQNL